ncbi:ABC-three component system middle component 6 [Campylobacter upsaliensis]|uniref:ABC-three component system middle component 6 n=1 Tax=Campylobacter upsaliensis TaxID=28080 RepID=UPI0022EB6C0C|nr:ABC-three component system middle component 6 [Campylobacter upsaliensis]
MIITERNPKQSLYFLGVALLEILKNKNMEYSLFELYEQFQKKYNIEIKKFILILDWLYLANYIEITQEGFIIKCS